MVECLCILGGRSAKQHHSARNVSIEIGESRADDETQAKGRFAGKPIPKGQGEKRMKPGLRHGG